METKHKIFDSSDSNVSKFVFEFPDKGNGEAIAEAVLYKYESYEKRTVICCSTQSGCMVGCAFCGTGGFFVRSLEWYEITRQVQTCVEHTGVKAEKIEKFQIMFMSMGEPFNNFLNTKLAIEVLSALYPNAQLLVSTSAPTSGMKHMSEFINLSKLTPNVGLQFSVHEAYDEDRTKLIPTPTCTLRQIAALGEVWAAFTERKPYFNYCVHPNNSSEMHAEQLAKTFNPDVWECTLSVICQKNESVKSSIDRQLNLINSFREMMEDKGFHLRVFNPAGQDDIGGGCGQLWYFQHWLKENKE